MMPISFCHIRREVSKNVEGNLNDLLMLKGSCFLLTNFSRVSLLNKHFVRTYVLFFKKKECNYQKKKGKQVQKSRFITCCAVFCRYMHMMFISKRHFAWNDMIKTLTIKILIYTLYLRFIVIYRRNLLRSVLITYYCSLQRPCYLQSYLSWFWATGYNRG